ncbi:MAG: hypothetical protein RL642_654 [Bacteroidota bacterium]
MIIAGSDGPISLSIPVVGGRSVKVSYKEVQIDYTGNWQRDHFRTLCTAYGNSAFFMFYRDELEILYKESPVFLYEWNLSCLHWLSKKLKIEKIINIKNDGLSIPESFDDDLYKPQSLGNDSDNKLFRYHQVFQDKTGFLPNLSILDPLFNLGPDVKSYLLNASTKL